MFIESYYISEKYFTESEIKSFKEKYNYDLKEIEYSSTVGEIDFSQKDEKEFLLQKGYPKILARFFAS